MNIKCSVYIAASIDGYIARAGNDIDWLARPEYSGSNLNGLNYNDFISSVDALVMGRNTFEKALTFGDWPYEGTDVIVLSSRTIKIPDHLHGKVRGDSGAPEAIVRRLAAEGKRHVYVDGGITIQRFLTARLIHEITITHIPILLGGGIPLFGRMDIEQPLRLIDATASENGLVQLRYEVLPAGNTSRAPAI
ncbi:MAG: dihydrofolate reductase [Nitrosomonadales bacterium]|nr:dihydrofolate reductase [Nitrosomonadales bacterium]